MVRTETAVVTFPIESCCMADDARMSFEEFASLLRERRSLYGFVSGFQIDDLKPNEAWSSLPYKRDFLADVESERLHGGVMTAMLDESCGAAVQAALQDGERAIATLDLRIDYLRAAKPGATIRAHSICYGVKQSIAFARATAYHDEESDPIAVATACFMIDANATRPLDRPTSYTATPLLEPEPGTSDPLLNGNLFAQCLGIRYGDDGRLQLPFSDKIIGNPLLPAIHGGIIGAFLETASMEEVRRIIGAESRPKPIGLTVNYLRSARGLDCYASTTIVRQGRRVVAFEARAWQDDQDRPVASAYGHFMLRADG